MPGVRDKEVFGPAATKKLNGLCVGQGGPLIIDGWLVTRGKRGHIMEGRQDSLAVQQEIRSRKAVFLSCGGRLYEDGDKYERQ